METKQEIVIYLKEDLSFTIEILQDKYLSKMQRAYNEGRKDITIRLLQLLNAYDDSLIDKIKEDNFYEAEIEDSTL